MFERSKASLTQLQVSLEQAIEAVRSGTAAVRLEIEQLDKGVFSAVDRVQVQIEKARRAAQEQLALVRNRINELKPPEK
jgi:hypothetical protein